MTRLLTILMGLWLWLGTTALAETFTDLKGQVTTPTAETLQALTGPERTALLARLSDSQARDLLLSYLVDADASRSVEVAPDKLLLDVEQKGELIRANASALFSRVDDIPAAFGATYAKLAGGSGLFGLLQLVVALGLILVIGHGAEWLYTMSVRRARHELMARRSVVDGWFVRSVLLLVLDLISVAVFSLGYALAFLSIWQGNSSRRQLAIGLLVAIVSVRFSRCIADFIFSPESDGPRLIPFDSTGAVYFRDYAVRITIVGAASFIMGYLIGVWSGDLYVRFALMLIAGGVFLVYFAVAIWSGRHYVEKAFLSAGAGGPAEPWGMRLLAQSWASIVIVYVASMYISTSVAALAGAKVSIASFLASVIVVVIGIPVADCLLGLFLSRKSQPENRVLRRARRITLVVIAALLVLQLLGVNVAARAETTIGALVARLVLDVGLVIVISYVVWELVIAAINRKLAKEAPVADARGVIDSSKAGRLLTLLPIFRKALQIAIIVIAGLMILSSLGVDIGPMLAGAGVLGLAIGFGAQTLVKDLISGLFFLLDDAFRVGEYIEVAGVAGSVERINTRSLSLRTPTGAVHTVPFGGMDAVANYSRDWVIVKMEFKVTYNTDLGKVKRIFKRIGEELSQDSELAPGFIQPFKFQGVKAMEETGINVRGKFMAVPGTQFQIRKQVFERVQKAFAAEGIEFAQRRVQVDLPPGLELDDSAKEAIGRAAAAAIATETPPNASSPKGQISAQGQGD